jgi:hypothetical protein
MRRAAAGAFGAAIVAYLVFAALPWLTRDRDFPSTIPQPPPLTAQSLVQMKAGDDVCMRDVAMEPHAGQARFVTGSYGRAGPALELRISGPGYRVRRHIAAGYPDNHSHVVAIDGPPRNMLVTVCIRDQGPRKVALYGANDRARSRVQVTNDGVREGVAPQLAFYEARPASIADRLGSVVERLAAFRAFLGHTWLVWLLALLSLIGVPLAIGYGLWRVAEDE